MKNEEQRCEEQQKTVFRRLFGLGPKKEECEVFVRKDSPHACTTALADFASVCGCSCCGVSVA